MVSEVIYGFSRVYGKLRGSNKPNPISRLWLYISQAKEVHDTIQHYPRTKQ
jgi:hypothetical protein